MNTARDFKRERLPTELKNFLQHVPCPGKKWQNIGTYMARQGDFNSSVLIQTSICNNVSGSDTEDANRKVCSII